MVEAVNIDGLTDSELQAFYDAKNKLFQALPFGTLEESGQRRYALLTIKARKARLAGNIQEALNYEARAEHVYSMLPKAIRW